MQAPLSRQGSKIYAGEVRESRLADLLAGRHKRVARRAYTGKQERGRLVR